MTARIAAVLVVVGAVVGANALLLIYGTSRHDPVGRLSPIAHVQLTTPPAAPTHVRAVPPPKVEDD